MKKNKHKQQNQKQNTKEQIINFLPAALERAICSYNNFSNNQNSGKNHVKDSHKNLGKNHDNFLPSPEDFKKHHAASKEAIAHIQQLLKLEQWTESPPTNPTQKRSNSKDNNSNNKISPQELQKMIQTAKRKVADFDKRNKETNKQRNNQPHEKQ